MNPGVYTDISNADYHGGLGMSKTKLDMFDKDQSSLEWLQKCPVDTEKLKTLDFGDAMHAICLEPERLKTDFVVMPPFNLRSNAGKEEKQVWLAEQKEGVAILTADEHKKLGLMFESVMAHPYARTLIENPGVSESSYYWIDPDTGVLCKCRPDRKMQDLPVVVDVKTVPELAKFKFSVDDYRYDVQDAFYSDGVSLVEGEQHKFVFLEIQKTIELGRYPVRCEELPPEARKYGREQYKQNLSEYAVAKETGRFNGIYEAELSHNYMRKAGMI